jgi:predicted MFS family arabinose efflux permease
MDRTRPLYALVAANAISTLGNVVSAVALPWLVLVTTGSAAKTGLTAFVITVPFAVSGLFGAAISDRIGARRTSVIGDSLSAAAVAAVPFLHAVDRLEFWHVLALGFLKSVFDAPGTAARRALLPELAEQAKTTLERANSLYVSTEHIGYVAGAPLGGVAIAAVGSANVLWIDAASFALAAAIVAASVPEARRTARAGAGYFADVVFGLMVGLLVPLHQTVFHERTPPELHARVFGIFVALTTTSGSIGMLVAGVLTDSVGLRAVLLLLAAGFGLFLTVSLFHLRKARDAYPRHAQAQLGVS